MSWGLGWKRPSEVFHLALSCAVDAAAADADGGANGDDAFRIEMDWQAGDDEEQVALRFQSKLMVELPQPQDSVLVRLDPVLEAEGAGEGEVRVTVGMVVERRREPLRVARMWRVPSGGQQGDGAGVLARLMKSNLLPAVLEGGALPPAAEHWRGITVLCLGGCGISVLPVELTRLPLLEKLFLDNNKLTSLPPELGELKSLKVLRVDNNTLVSVPAELRQCVKLVELSLEHNKLVRPLLDFRAMAELRVLRLFGNPLEFLPEILPLQKLRHLSLANVRIEATESLKSISVHIETENSSYFMAASRHKLSAFFSLIFRFSSCHHPLLASTLAKMMEDQSNRQFISKEESAGRQLISMISSDNHHVVEQACLALSSLASDITVAMQLVKCDIMQPIESVLQSDGIEELVSVLQVVATLAFVSDLVAQKILTKEILRSLKMLCSHKNSEVQRLALIAVGNLAFCLENRRTLTQSESLRELLLHLTVSLEQTVSKAAARALAILGENECLRRAIRGKPIGKKGLRILTMDGGGMKGLSTVQMLKQIEEATGKRIFEMFDLICGTSTGGMLAIALGIKRMSLDQCEEIYKNLGKLVFAEPVPKDETASWKEKLDQLFKSSSQSFRVVVHGSKHSADQFERLLKDMCADEDGDLLIESAIKGVPKVFVVSTLVSVMPAQPFIFRNYQYPAGIVELPAVITDSPTIGSTATAACGAQVGPKHAAYMGSCKHLIWQAIRASSAAPYYLDDFSDDINRWQDGAIVANNPTVFAIREAQLLWPDTRIECLVSVGCGSVPTKARKGGWRYLDTGQVLIESACSVERVEETMDTLIPMLPEMHYFRFNPVDERCGMELDETDPTIWNKLEAATSEYIKKNIQSFDHLCELLAPRSLNDEKSFEKMQHSSKFQNDNISALGWRRMVLLIESSTESLKNVSHARSLESFCAGNGIKLAVMSQTSGFSKAASTVPAPITSPLITGSFPSSPLYSPDGTAIRGRIDLVPPLSLDGHQISKASPPPSPSVSREPSLHARLLHEKLQNLPQVGVIHLALQNDCNGSVLSWQSDVFVVAEPGDLADRFIQSVKTSLLTLSYGHRRKAVDSLSKTISSLADLVAAMPCFEVGGVLHRYIGRQTQVMEDDQEIGAYMFRRTVPAIHLAAEDVRWMAGAWRDRIIISSGKYSLPAHLVKSLLDSGAKAVISSSVQPPQSSQAFASQPADENALDNGKFVIGDDEDEVEGDGDRTSGMSDFEDSDDAEKGSELFSWNDYSEEYLSEFLRNLYEKLFSKGLPIDDALHQALSSFKKLKFTCHLPYK